MPWVNEEKTVRPEGPREYGRRALAAFQAACGVGVFPQGIGLRPQPWAGLCRPVGPDSRRQEEFKVSVMGACPLPGGGHLPRGGKLFCETRKPFRETRKPFRETRKPFRETRKPFRETRKPFRETRKPFRETRKPFREARKTLRETRAAV